MAFLFYCIAFCLPENENVLVSDFHDLLIRIIKEEEDDYQHKDSPVPEDAVAHGLELLNQGSLDSVREGRVFQDLSYLDTPGPVPLFLKRIE